MLVNAQSNDVRFDAMLRYRIELGSGWLDASLFALLVLAGKIFYRTLRSTQYGQTTRTLRLFPLNQRIWNQSLDHPDCIIAPI
jgi:hypothetical protein